MKKQQIQECHIELNNLADKLNTIYGTEKPSKLKPLIEDFNSNLKSFEKKLPKRDSTVQQEVDILRVYQQLVGEYKDFLIEFEYLIRKKENNMEEKTETQPLEEFKIKEEDETTIRKKHELMTLKEFNKQTEELQKIQDMISKRLLEDSESIDQIYFDSTQAVDSSKKAVGELSEVSKKERNSRLRWFQAGGTGVGAFFGHVWGAVAGFFVTNRLSKVIRNKHDKKLEEIKRMDS